MCVCVCVGGITIVMHVCVGGYHYSYACVCGGYHYIVMHVCVGGGGYHYSYDVCVCVGGIIIVMHVCVGGIRIRIYKLHVWCGAGVVPGTKWSPLWRAVFV